MLRRHKCDLCKRRFGRVEELMQHQQVIHGKESLYECGTCSMKFTNGEDLKAHAKRYHAYKKK
ncbi:MAG: C2H2-type zinc finger protein [Nitrososphaerales archaeon]